jgi:N-methylhydantoinase A/oxoprolinase/acetone carboxylase beta subunit
MTAQIRLGADIGGTFTDIALEHGGRFHSTKVLTTHAAPSRRSRTGRTSFLPGRVLPTVISTM